MFKLIEVKEIFAVQTLTFTSVFELSNMYCEISIFLFPSDIGKKLEVRYNVGKSCIKSFPRFSLVLRVSVCKCDKQIEVTTTATR